MQPLSLSRLKKVRRVNCLMGLSVQLRRRTGRLAATIFPVLPPRFVVCYPAIGHSSFPAAPRQCSTQAKVISAGQGTALPDAARFRGHESIKRVTTRVLIHAPRTLALLINQQERNGRFIAIRKDRVFLDALVL